MARCLRWKEARVRSSRKGVTAMVTQPVIKMLAISIFLGASLSSASAQEGGQEPVKIPNSLLSQCAGTADYVGCVEKLEAAQRRINERNAAREEAAARDRADRARAARDQ